jgi:catechol 2,3-dioxygenase-like lactoylglutathione lyase family enzyme
LSNFARHVGIVVNDLEKGIHFWQELIGFKIVSDNIEPSPYIEELLSLNATNLRTVKFSDNKGFIVELLKFDSSNKESDWQGDLSTTGLTHIALTVESVEKLVNKLNEFSYTSLSKIMKSPNGQVKVVFINGPENLKLEMVEVLP